MENILQWNLEKSTTNSVLPDSERFTSSILPKFMRKTPTLKNVIPTLQ